MTREEEIDLIAKRNTNFIKAYKCSTEEAAGWALKALDSVAEMIEPYDYYLYAGLVAARWSVTSDAALVLDKPVKPKEIPDDIVEQFSNVDNDITRAVVLAMTLVSKCLRKAGDPTHDYKFTVISSILSSIHMELRSNKGVIH